jgi:hypothetical protein
VKSSPHRVALTWCGTALVFCGTVVWILVRKKWTETDTSDPGRALAEEMARSVAMTARRFAAAGAAMWFAVVRGWRDWRSGPEAAKGKCDAASDVT